MAETYAGGIRVWCRPVPVGESLGTYASMAALMLEKKKTGQADRRTDKHNIVALCFPLCTQHNEHNRP